MLHREYHFALVLCPVQAFQQPTFSMHETAMADWPSWDCAHCQHLATTVFGSVKNDAPTPPLPSTFTGSMNLNPDDGTVLSSLQHEHKQ